MQATPRRVLPTPLPARRHAGALVLCVALSVLSSTAVGEAVRPLALPFGPTALDLNQDGQNDLVMRSWRESHNGDGYAILSFHVNSGPDAEIFTDARDAERDPAPPPRSGDLWETVMIETDRPGVFDDAIREAESGHCALRKAALFQPRLAGPDDDSVLLLVAEKRGYDSVFDRLSVSLTFHALAVDEIGVPGAPRYRFQRVHRLDTRERYCDAGVALEAFVAGRDPGMPAEAAEKDGDPETIR